MKQINKSILFAAVVVLGFQATGCSLFKRGKGCPTDGRNIGAERVAAGDLTPKEAKKAKKAKFRG